MTPEERQLWREANKHTLKTLYAPESEEPILPPMPNTPFVKPRPVVHEFLSVPRSKTPLEPLTQREATKRFKPYGEIEATLDLHGMTRHEAQDKVQHFIIRSHRYGCRHIAIITGKGRGQEIGVLRKELPHWLNEPALRFHISGFAHAKPEKGGAGVMHVLLKR